MNASVTADPTHEYTVCLDFGRQVVWLVPICSFAAALVKGLSGVGEAIIFTVIWQIGYIIGIGEADDLGLLASLISVQQCLSTAQMAFADFKVWRHYIRAGALYAASMILLSPLGNHVRETAPTETIRVVLACIFLVFGLSKVLVDGVRLVGSRRALPQSEAQSASAGEFVSIGVSDIGGQGSSIGQLSSEEADASSIPQEKDGVDDVPMENSCSSEMACDPHATCVEPAAETNQNVERSGTPATPESGHAMPASKMDDLPPIPGWLFKALPFVGCCGGFLGGMCGMNGPPFILMASFTGLDRKISRSLFPMGQMPEVWCFRLPMLISLGRISAKDFHLYMFSYFTSQMGIHMGTVCASKISQLQFERTILGFIILSSISILGIFQGHPRAVIALVVVVCILLLRVGCQWWASSEKKRKDFNAVK